MGTRSAIAIGAGLVLAAAGACKPPECDLVACENNWLRACVQSVDGPYIIRSTNCTCQHMTCSEDQAACVLTASASSGSASSGSASSGSASDGECGGGAGH